MQLLRKTRQPEDAGDQIQWKRFELRACSKETCDTEVFKVHITHVLDRPKSNPRITGVLLLVLRG